MAWNDFGQAARSERPCVVKSKSEFARAIRAYRTHEGVTQKHLGDACGVSSAAVAQWESGRVKLSEETIRKVAKAFGYKSAIVFLSAAREAISETL